MRQYLKTIEASKVSGEYEKTNVWSIPTATSKDYTAVFPNVGDIILFIYRQPY